MQSYFKQYIKTDLCINNYLHKFNTTQSKYNWMINATYITMDEL